MKTKKGYISIETVLVGATVIILAVLVTNAITSTVTVTLNDIGNHADNSISTQ